MAQDSTISRRGALQGSLTAGLVTALPAAAYSVELYEFTAA